jgi:hypothetical protein
VTLQPGATATVKLQVNRGGHTGPAQFQVTGLPEGVSSKCLDLPADKAEGQLELVADLKLGDKETKAKVKVAVKVGTGQAEKTFDLTIPKVFVPSFQAAKEVLLQPGGSAVLDLAVNRNEFQGPLELRVESVLPKVMAKVSRLEANQNSVKLQLAAAADAPDVNQAIRVVGTVVGRTVAVEVPVRVDRTPFRVQAFRVVTLEPGQKRKIELPIERRSYLGPLEIEPLELPEGVRIARATVGPDQKSVALEIVADENAKERVRTARVQAKGGSVVRSEPIVIRVYREGEGFLPREMLNDPLLRRGSFGGRLTAKSKRALVEAYGGTPESEAAVMRGLKWLAAHQQPDGRWSLKAYDTDIENCDCRDAKFEEKVVEEDVAGTAFGVLPFLGAGVAIDRSPEEPKELAEYQSRVQHAIEFLVRSQSVSKDPLQDGRLSGNMYAHAAATIALCEAYGLSGDRWKDRLLVPTQKAIRFIAQAQHKNGGWRYAPRQEGDMSAVAWQFLAIRSGQLAGMTIGSDPLVRAERFVDSCAAGPEGAEKSQYSYQPGEGPQKAKISLTAAGLLTRQYLGRWKKDHPDLAAGCKEIMKNLPPESGSNLGPIYYYYYATQVLHHMEGEDFDLWNARMREHLIRTQEKTGHKTGSWNPNGVDHGAAGGRLYATGMALMTLEVYYRHLPMYRTVQKKARRSIDPLAPVEELQ